MAKIGPKQKQRRAALMNKELQVLIEQFGEAMRTAYPCWIADTGRMTPKMSEVWNRYIMFCTDIAHEEKRV